MTTDENKKEKEKDGKKKIVRKQKTEETSNDSKDTSKDTQKQEPPKKKKAAVPKMTVDKAIELVKNGEIKSVKDLKKFRKDLIAEVLKKLFPHLGLELKPKVIKSLKWMPWEDFGALAFEVITKTKDKL